MGFIALILFAIFWFFCCDKFEKGNAHDTLVIWGVIILIGIVAGLLGMCAGAV